MPNIYELKKDFDTLWSVLEDELVDPEALLGAFDTVTEELDIKLENCCKYIKNQEAVIAGLKEEEKRISQKRKAKENAIERLKQLMKETLDAAGEKKREVGTFSVSVQANPKSVVLDVPLSDIPSDYLKFKEPELDKKKLKEEIESGVAPEGIDHLVQTTSLRIR